mmetsp:Transcript_63003/g.179040  ORF Transcript_63003/g.179040 Transcript_63003/m.179040 type:complete len:146 (-) Transcript_63003:1950-2387(-)
MNRLPQQLLLGVPPQGLPTVRPTCDAPAAAMARSPLLPGLMAANRLEPGVPAALESRQVPEPGGRLMQRARRPQECHAEAGRRQLRRWQRRGERAPAEATLPLEQLPQLLAGLLLPVEPRIQEALADRAPTLSPSSGPTAMPVPG